MNSQKGYYQVAGYQGNLYYRYVGYTDTTVYMDELIASFDTEEEAKQYIREDEEDYFETYFQEVWLKEEEEEEEWEAEDEWEED